MDYKAGWNPTLHLSIQTLFKQLSAQCCVALVFGMALSGNQ